MTILSIAIILSWAVFAAMIAAYVARVSSEITYVTLADGRKTERRLPLVFRLILPAVPNVERLIARPFFNSSCALADKMLIASGLEGLLSGREFVAIKLLMPLVLGTLWVFFVLAIAAILPNSFLSANRVVLSILGVAWTWLWPIAWLKRTYKARHHAIFKALPFVLDLLTLSVEAGMDFMSALSRNCNRRKIDPLNEELIRMTREIQVGTPRRIALRHLADRVGQPDLKQVAFSLIQADELGVPIGSILRIQAEQLRQRRFERAEKLANEAPVKMLGPLMLCIFPAVFVVLLGPIIMQAARGIF